MEMTREEIVRDFQQAKNKPEQIQILADLNLCKKSEIAAILLEAGCEGIPKYWRKKFEASETAGHPPSPPAAEEETPEKNDALLPEPRHGMTMLELFEAMARFCSETDELSDVKLFTQDGKRVGTFFVTGDYNTETGEIDWFVTLCTED